MAAEEAGNQAGGEEVARSMKGLLMKGVSDFLVVEVVALDGINDLVFPADALQDNRFSAFG